MTKLEGMYKILSLCEELNIPKNSINSIMNKAGDYPLIEGIVIEAMIQYKRVAS